MNLQALYDLKERLEKAAIAGTGLMQEDFRLHRAVEAMAPLAGVNPVFAKITAAAKALLAAPQAERSTRLLDVLSLVDAVVYTQGLSNLPGDLSPMAPGCGTYTEISYGQLQPLLTALSGTGSGRTALIQNTYSEHPEYFSDFRVLPHVVKALGESYTELADFICLILLKQGPSIIPMLKDGFDPAGKTEMTRRIHLIARLAGAAENDWFVSVLPDTQKDVREAVIQALGLSQDNAGLLLDLCRSERGKLKDAALRSLAMMKDPVCIDHLTREVRKKKDNIAFLKGADSIVAADLAADAVQTKLETFLENSGAYDQKTLGALNTLTAVLAGKYSSRTAQLWHWIADHMDAFAAIVPEKNVMNSSLSVAEYLQKTFLQTILWNPCSDMTALARSLAEENREWFLCGGFLSDMAELSASAVYDTYGPLIVRSGILKRETPAQRSDRIQIMRGLSAVRWSSQLHSYVVTFSRYDALTGQRRSSIRKLDGVDRRWMQLLTDPKIQTDGAVYDLSNCEYLRKAEPAMDLIIGWLIDGDDPEICSLAGEWFYQWTRHTGHFHVHFGELVQCGWKNWQGLLAGCIEKHGSVSYYNIMEWIPRLPVSDAQKAEELRRIDQLVRGKKVKVLHGHWPEALVSAQIAALEAQANGGM